MVTEAAQEGDPLAVELLADPRALDRRGLAASVAALLDPELIVIGGGVGAAGDLLLGPVRRGFEAQLSARGHRPVAKIELAEHGNEAGIVGAADLAAAARLTTWVPITWDGDSYSARRPIV